MSELSGTLEGVGLPAIVRFLTGLKKTGCLQVQHEGWHGEVFFARGEVCNAALGSHRGLPALDALVENQSGSSFTFDSDAPVPPAADIDLPTDAVLARLDEVASRGAKGGVPHLPELDAVPSLVPQPEGNDADDPLPLDRGTLQTLLAIDGARTVREIINQRGSFDALWQIGNLVEVGLVRIEAPQVKQAPPQNVRPIGVEVPTTTTEIARCPKLGFEDDPSTSFGRPTRLHRCFAAGTPLPLSLDQQRELCISEQFGTCPRLAMAQGRPAPEEPDDSRIVRLPVGGRGAVADRQAVGGADPARARPARETAPARPTPLRSRQERNTTAPPEPAAAAPREPVAPEARASRPSIIDDTPERRVVGVPVQALAAGAVVIVVLAAIGFLIGPHLGDLFSDSPSDVDLSSLPNTSALVAGTPIAQLTPRPTSVAGRPNSAANAPGSSPSGASAANAPAQPTLPPEPTSAPTAAPTETVSVAGVTVFDERFTDNARKWPSSPQGTASMFPGGGYRLIPRAVGQFVAVGAPLTTPLEDVVVSATFHKVSGPAGGGYGVILRDQASAPQNGTTQNGSYYVLEIGDKGDVGIWRRDGDHWVDLLPWQHADAVKTGSGTNDVTARAMGDRLTLSVNGVEVATRTDASLKSGLVGVFTGGDGNIVSVDRFTVQTP